jgi:hypothetical protein
MPNNNNNHSSIDAYYSNNAYIPDSYSHRRRRQRTPLPAPLYDARSASQHNMRARLAPTGKRAHTPPAFAVRRPHSADATPRLAYARGNTNPFYNRQLAYPAEDIYRQHAAMKMTAHRAQHDRPSLDDSIDSIHGEFGTVIFDRPI